ncbi:MAG: galactose ABC transporter substrate-binding protein [Oscillospiraceae bacterium]|nr:galactose ABC transporter substrate-binding protein [Oscillospiraceae bacterium]
MKRKWIAIAALFAALLLLSGIIAVCALQKKDAAQALKIGVSVYKSDDTFITGVMADLQREAKEYEQSTGNKLHLDLSDAAESQRLQNEQVKRYISLDYDVLLVNLVDRTNASTIIDAVASAGIPVVFFNREPVEEDLLRCANLYYVGSDAKESAVLQGEILAEAWQKNAAAIDKNQNGMMDYVMLEGELGHQDATIRTKWSVQTLIDLGVPVQKVAGGVANWSRSQAAAIMEQLLGQHSGDIEVVIANNDDMALGALDALEKMAIEGVHLVGIDATAPGAAAVREGKMLGTVDCDSATYANVLLSMARALGQGAMLPPDIEVENGRYVRIHLNKLT